MREIQHSDITKQLNHQTFHYQQDTDPGAVGAGKWWLDTTVLTEGEIQYSRLKYRNDANDGWVTL
jgi:hypothetical protein